MSPSFQFPNTTDHRAPSHRLMRQIGMARELAHAGRPGPARRLAAGLFLDSAPLLERDPILLQAFIACLLLLEMPALLPRVLRAVFGVELDIVPAAAQGGRRWSLSFRGGLALIASLPARTADRAVQDETSARLAQVLIDAASRDAGPIAAPAPTPIAELLPS